MVVLPVEGRCSGFRCSGVQVSGFRFQGAAVFLGIGGNGFNELDGMAFIEVVVADLAGTGELIDECKPNETIHRAMGTIVTRSASECGPACTESQALKLNRFLHTTDFQSIAVERRTNAVGRGPQAEVRGYTWSPLGGEDL
jgi:hypothetical protein